MCSYRVLLFLNIIIRRDIVEEAAARFLKYLYMKWLPKFLHVSSKTEIEYHYL